MFHVLVIDDEAFCVFVLQELLREHGFSVATATGASEALDRAKERMPDIIVSDFRLPGSRTGIDIARILKEKRPSVQVILFTGADSREVKEEADSLPCFALVVKPCEPEGILEIVRNAADSVSCQNRQLEK